MSICAKHGCTESYSGSKQTNVYVIRAYLCKKHLIESAQFDGESYKGAQAFIAWLKEKDEFA
jgi:hypothetical protein